MNSFKLGSFKGRAISCALAFVLVCVGAFAAGLMAKPLQKAQAEDAAPEEVSIYRLYNSWTTEAFFTASQQEYQGLIAKGWRDEGVGWIAPSSGDAVYRLYNPWTSEHHYTTGLEEYQKCMRDGWVGENIVFYSRDTGDWPIYRLFNQYKKEFYHHYTIDEAEYRKCIEDGWTDESVGWFALARPTAVVS